METRKVTQNNKPETDFKTIDQYIDAQTEQIKPTLELLRQTIRAAAPEAVEVISYQMPALKYHGILVYFAAFKNHYSLFAMPSAIHAFKDKLSKYKLSKGTIQFPNDEPVPVELVTEIIKFKAQENLQKMLMKKSKKKYKKVT
jgi:uncharacterized protein YdhG (YjbR/CyaY superfamily)